MTDEIRKRNETAIPFFRLEVNAHGNDDYFLCSAWFHYIIEWESRVLKWREKPQWESKEKKWKELRERESIKRVERVESNVVRTGVRK